MKKTISALLVCAGIISVAHQCKGQLVVNAGGTPTQIVNSFIGAGLTVSNAVINCGAAGYGTFIGTATGLGLDSGILLTTGLAAYAIGPNNSNAQNYCYNTIFNDSQLMAIEPLATHDVCILEFDVVPHCSSMTLRFVFGSEEYPEYVNSVYNDVFGLFVTGSGPNCEPGFYRDSNVAVLPGGTAVSINNINEGNWAGCPTTQTGCNNCAYYVNNCGCTSAPCLQYDGYTVPISVTLDVCPCSSYHWKFAIADAGDCDFDSGIFIESLEACSSNLAYTVDSAASHCDGCNGAAMVNISAGAPPYTYLWSPGGQSTATASNLCPGSYTVSVTDANNCDNPIIQTVSIGTIDTMTLSISSTDASCSSCNNGSITITVNGGAMPYYYYIIPDTSGLLTGNTFINLLPGNYYVCAVDTIGCQACDSVQISYPLSVNASYAKQYFYFYPNPAHNTFTISLKEELGIANWELGIYDVTGRVVHEQKIHSQLSTVNCQLSAGVYFVKVSDGEKVYGQKLVVE